MLSVHFAARTARCSKPCCASAQPASRHLRSCWTPCSVSMARGLLGLTYLCRPRSTARESACCCQSSSAPMTRLKAALDAEAGRAEGTENTGCLTLLCLRRPGSSWAAQADPSCWPQCPQALTSPSPSPRSWARGCRRCSGCARSSARRRGRACRRPTQCAACRRA